MGAAGRRSRARGEAESAGQSVAIYGDRGFGKAAGFGSRPALLVIDMMVAFTNPKHAVGFVQDEVIAAISRLARTTRAAGLPVVFVTTEYGPDGSDGGMMGRKIPGLYDLISGSVAIELDPRLDRDEGDLGVVKGTASAFYATELETLLRRREVDTVVTAGCTTSGCVRATVVDGIARGFHMIVPREAVADRAPAAGAASLTDIDAKYGDVLSESEASLEIERLAVAGR